jgi:hypothetical protein
MRTPFVHALLSIPDSTLEERGRGLQLAAEREAFVDYVGPVEVSMAMSRLFVEH